MISYLKPLPVGNAVRIILAPPSDAARWKVLRRPDPGFTGHDDTSAAVILSGRATSTVDHASLSDNTVYYYRPYYLIGADWVAGDTDSVLVRAATAVVGVDPLSLVRARLEAGLRLKVNGGELFNAGGLIPCFTAPPTFDNTNFPIVTVHLDDDRARHRALGEVVEIDEVDDDGNWVEGEGWIGAYQIKIVGWVVENADSRVNLRKAIKEVLTANMPVFRSAGMDQIEFSMSDIEDMETYQAPVYQTLTTLTCVAPYIVTNTVEAISDVTVNVNDA